MNCPHSQSSSTREREGDCREIGDASSRSHLGARLDIGFEELTVAGTPYLAAVPETRLVVTALNRMLHLERPESVRAA